MLFLVAGLTFASWYGTRDRIGATQNREVAMRRWIRSLPWWARPFMWLAVLPLLFFGWVVNEMFGQAKAGAKRMFAPLLWPVAGLGGLLVLYGTLGPQGF